MLPLEGITVVALEQAVAAPFATRQLADLGARVIKIERLDAGDFSRDFDHTVRGMSSYFVWLNRSKESLTLDIKHPEASHILHQLLTNADIFIQNLAPGAIERLGLSAESLRQKYPRLIACGISGYGSPGPHSEKKAYDLMAQCESGLISLTGTPEHPSKVGISVADIATGMYAFSGILTALYQRERTGTGTTLEITLLEALGEWMGAPAYFTAYGGNPPSRTGAHHATIAPYGPFGTSDGKLAFFAVQNAREWEQVCVVVLERPDLASDARFHNNAARIAHREELHAVIEAVLVQLTAEQVIARLEQAEIANARMNSVQEFWDHPQLVARNRWREVDSPVGPLKALLPPLNLDGLEPRMDPVPALGEHTTPILRSLGYGQEQIDQLRAEGAI